MIKKLAVLSTLAALASASHAVDGTVNITGMVSNVSCTVTTTANTIALPTVPVSALKTLGQTAGSTTWTVSVTGCTGTPTPTSVTTFFERGATTSASGRFLNTAMGPGAAQNVEVEVLTSALAIVNTNGNPGGQNVASSPLTAGAGAQTFVFRYYATAQAVAGTYTSNFSYTLIYA
jgi:major type 1 subunit fimbrin (pilin)